MVNVGNHTTHGSYWYLWLLRWWFHNCRPRMNKKTMHRFHNVGIISLPHFGSKAWSWRIQYLPGDSINNSITFEIPKKVTKNWKTFEIPGILGRGLLLQEEPQTDGPWTCWENMEKPPREILKHTHTHARTKHHHYHHHHHQYHHFHHHHHHHEINQQQQQQQHHHHKHSGRMFLDAWKMINLMLPNMRLQCFFPGQQHLSTPLSFFKHSSHFKCGLAIDWRVWCYSFWAKLEKTVTTKLA